MAKRIFDFSLEIKRKVRENVENRCERCGIDFDDEFQGEFHHIISVVHGGDNTEENCSLLCSDCHYLAPDLKGKEDLFLYRYYFLRFASFKEAAQYYGVKTRFDLYVKLAKEVAVLTKE